MKLAIRTTALLLALCAGAAFAQSGPSGSPPPGTANTKDPAVMALLQQMCDRLKTARTFTVRGRASLELAVTGGEVATFFNDFDTAVRRPNGLSAHRSGDLPEFHFCFDGKSMNVSVPSFGKWGTTSAPATIDAMLPAAGELGGLNMPFDELLVADPYAAVSAGVTGAVSAGQATIQGKKVEHLVLSSAQFRIEYWIDPATKLPARSLVVYVDHPVRPHFMVDYAEWKLDAKIRDSVFALPRPNGATEVSFGEAASAFR